MSERSGFSVDVEWDAERSRASATLRRDGAPPQLYEGDDPRAAAREACDAGLRGLPEPRGRPPATGEGRELRRVLLWTAIAGLCLSAVIAIVFFFAADTDWDDDWQIPTTTFAISVYSFLALGSAALLDRRPGSPLGRGGVATALVAGFLALLLIWFDSLDDNDFVVKLWAVATVAAVVSAHVALLLARARDGDGSPVRTTLMLTVATSSLLGTLVALAIVGEWDDGDWWRVLGSLAVLDLLGTALVPILRKLQD